MPVDRLYRLALQLRAFAALSAVPAAAMAGTGGDGLAAALLLAAAVSAAESFLALVLGARAVTARTLLAVDLATFAALQSMAGSSFPVVYFAAGTAALVGIRRGPHSVPVVLALVLAVCALVNSAPARSVGLLVVVPPLVLAAGVAGAAARSVLLRAEHARRDLAAERDRLATAEERARLARELHDTLLSSLHGSALSARALADLLRDAGPAGGGAGVLAGQLADSLSLAAGQAREVVGGLRSVPGGPGFRLDHAVGAAVRTWAAGAGIRPDCRLTPWPLDGPADPGLRHEVLRVLAEALSNVARHAAGSAVVVVLAVRHDVGTDLITLSVRDDGAGFDPGAAPRPGHFGLVGMAERATRLGGRLQVLSASGRGTEVVLELAVPSAVPQGQAA